METFLNAHEPVSTIAAGSCLACLTVLVEVHVEMAFKLLLAHRIATKANPTLLTLVGQIIVQKLGD